MPKLSMKCTQHSDRDGVHYAGLHCDVCGEFVIFAVYCEECDNKSNGERMSIFKARYDDTWKAHRETQSHIRAEKAFADTIEMW